MTQKFRSILAWAYCALGCLAGFMVCLLRPFNPDNNRVNARLIAWGSRRLAGMRVDVEGLEHLRADHPRVIIANHQHNEDLFILGGLLPRRTVTVGKSSLRWLPFFGQMFWLGGNVLINRGKGRQAISALKATSEAMQRDGKSVWIFPEGTRSRGRGLQPFKKGAFHAAVAAGVPITMICVSEYGAGSTPAGRVRVRVLPEIATQGLAEDQVPGLMAACREAMRATIADLSHRLPAAGAS